MLCCLNLLPGRERLLETATGAEATTTAAAPETTTAQIAAAETTATQTAPAPETAARDSTLEKLTEQYGYHVTVQCYHYE